MPTENTEPKQSSEARAASAGRLAPTGPVILQHAFRPFFMAAGIWAMLAVPFWVLTFFGLISLPENFDALLWHQHEMLYGFAAAAITGFILTAIPNWTGRRPVRGNRLLLLVVLWALGRAAMLLLPLIGPEVAAVLDLTFLTVLVLVIGRELVAGKNRKNFPVLVLITIFGFGNVLVHLELLGVAETASTGLRLSTFVLVLLMAVIGGRIVPSFTRNWLVKQGADLLPTPMNNFDKATLAALLALLILEVFMPDGRATAIWAVITGILIGIRLMRWRSWAVRSEPLLWVMHLGFAWLGLGLILIGLSSLTTWVPASSAIHALTTGAFGTMILAVMTRASLGHTGRPLDAGAGTLAIFVLVTIAALARVIVPLTGAFETPGIWLAAIAWTLAFGLFSILYFPVFTKPQAEPRSPSQVPK